MLGSPRYPEFVERCIAQNHAKISFKLPADLSYLDGHFPEFPILPGVVQLHWAVELAQEIFGINSLVSHGSQIKFSNVITSSEVIYELNLVYNSDKNMCSYRYKSQEKVYSSGNIHYSSPLKTGDK
ncbi:AMP-dependent ligase [Candidatus Odyssella thessalonicensis]|uniref:ApeI family dehydratase n=1 Tax=Candidatus Odyssella thessalonicensis TaxID=84647 RepID=UPI000225BFA0|nr:AMP-dependent ligase [Candidatus Odyssella thessalonicensis]